MTRDQQPVPTLLEKRQLETLLIVASHCLRDGPFPDDGYDPIDSFQSIASTIEEMGIWTIAQSRFAGCSGQFSADQVKILLLDYAGTRIGSAYVIIQQEAEGGRERHSLTACPEPLFKVSPAFQELTYVLAQNWPSDWKDVSASAWERLYALAGEVLWENR